MITAKYKSFITRNLSPLCSACRAGRPLITHISSYQSSSDSVVPTVTSIPSSFCRIKNAFILNWSVHTMASHKHTHIHLPLPAFLKRHFPSALNTPQILAAHGKLPTLGCSEPISPEVHMARFLNTFFFSPSVLSLGCHPKATGGYKPQRIYMQEQQTPEYLQRAAHKSRGHKSWHLKGGKEDSNHSDKGRKWVREEKGRWWYFTVRTLVEG